MSLAQILYPPPTHQGWKEWSWANFQHHLALESAILQLKGVQVASFRLWPVTEHDLKDWLQAHQEAHNAINAALGISGQDLSELDLKNKTKRDDWFYVHELQHQAAAQLLGSPTL